jgi:hypothetical protein
MAIASIALTSITIIMCIMNPKAVSNAALNACAKKEHTRAATIADRVHLSVPSAWIFRRALQFG